MMTSNQIYDYLFSFDLHITLLAYFIMRTSFTISLLTEIIYDHFNMHFNIKSEN